MLINHYKFSLKIIFISLSLSLFSACVNTPVTDPVSTSTPSPESSTATDINTVSPSPTVSPQATTSPVATPISTPTPSTTPTPEPTPEPTPTPTPEPTPTPTPTPEPTANVTVIVKDVDTSSVVQNAKVTIKSSDPNFDYEVDVPFVNGKNYLTGVPTNRSFEIIATKAGFNKQSKFITIPASTSDYTVEFKDKKGISTKPLVIAVKPSPGTTLGPHETLEITFSEVMDEDQVETVFGVQSEASSGTTFKVGTPIPFGTSVRGNTTDTIYDISQFNVEWDSQTMKVTPKYHWPLAVNTQFRIILSYIGNGGDGYIHDSGGNQGPQAVDSIEVSQLDGPFYTTNEHRPFISYSISNSGVKKADVSNVTAVNSDSGDFIRIEFTKPLRFTTETGKEVVGGANGSNGSAPAGHASVTAADAAKNYNVIVNNTQVPIPASGRAIFDTDSSIKLLVTPPDQLFNSSGETGSVSFSSILGTSGEFLNETIGFTVQ